MVLLHDFPNFGLEHLLPNPVSLGFVIFVINRSGVKDGSNSASKLWPPGSPFFLDQGCREQSHQRHGLPCLKQGINCMARRQHFEKGTRSYQKMPGNKLKASFIQFNPFPFPRRIKGARLRMFHAGLSCRADKPGMVRTSMSPCSRLHTLLGLQKSLGIGHDDEHCQDVLS